MHSQIIPEGANGGSKFKLKEMLGIRKLVINL